MTACWCVLAVSSWSTGVEVGDRVLGEWFRPDGFARAVGDGDELHLATTLSAEDRSLGRLLLFYLLGQQVTPTAIEPHQHLHPVQLQVAVGTQESVVTNSLKSLRQDVL